MSMQNLDPYDKKVLEALHRKFPYSECEAQRIFRDYEEPLRMLDGYDSPDDRALQLHTIVSKGMSPKDWVKHINKARDLRNKSRAGHERNVGVVDDKSKDITTALEDVEHTLIAVQQIVRQAAKASAFRDARYGKAPIFKDVPGSSWVEVGKEGHITGSANLDLVKKIAAKPFILKRRTEVKNS